VLISPSGLLNTWSNITVHSTTLFPWGQQLGRAWDEVVNARWRPCLNAIRHAGINILEQTRWTTTVSSLNKNIRSVSSMIFNCVTYYPRLTYNRVYVNIMYKNWVNAITHHHVTLEKEWGQTQLIVQTLTSQHSWYYKKSSWCTRKHNVRYPFFHFALLVISKTLTLTTILKGYKWTYTHTLSITNMYDICRCQSSYYKCIR